MEKIIRLAVIFYIMAILPCTERPELYAQDNSNAARPKYALVIGNGAYTSLPPLANPVNDANDIAAVLVHLGFAVERVLNGTLEEMEDAAAGFIARLGAAKNSYCFFYYAGHAVQSNGENYLIPVNSRIPGENYLRNRAMSVQELLDDLDGARNDLNVVVLDACRDNPFGWNRSGSRGLATTISQPANSMIIYSTGAGASASDGNGRNGLFTSKLINNLATPGIEVAEAFRRTGQEVAATSYNQQVPAIYSQFFGTAFLGDIPVDFQGVMIPGTTVIIGGKEKEPEPAKLWSIGASVGSSFGIPWIIGTAHGTIAPFKYTFFELGLDFGLVSGKSDVNYNSFIPYGHIAFFYPLHEKIGAYAGLGGGFMVASYRFKDEGNIQENIPAAAATAGFNLFNMIDISYTFRTNFKGVMQKLSIGYVYRFQ